MNQFEFNTATYYDINPALAQAYAPVFSYAYDAKSPIAWTHYSHFQTSSQYNSALRDKNWCSLFIFLSGNFSFLLNGHMYTPKFGDAVVIRNHEKYTTLFPEASQVDYYQIYFPSEFFEKTKATNLFLKPFFDRKNADRNLISPDKASSAKMFEHLKELDSLCTSTNECRDVLMYSHIIQIMEIVYSAFVLDFASHSNAKIPQKLNDAILYIHSTFSTLENVSDVASTCNISNAYLSRIFKTYLECTPNEYITRLRISHAKYLLSNGESITDVCFKSGFNNYTYFISKFKQVTGTTPSKFSKKAK